jgi:flagellar biosynthesis GTPase FlhF
LFFAGEHASLTHSWMQGGWNRPSGSFRKSSRRESNAAAHCDGVFPTQFQRDGFIAFMGPEKSGKTTMLIDVAWRGVQQSRRRVGRGLWSKV